MPLSLSLSKCLLTNRASLDHLWPIIYRKFGTSVALEKISKPFSLKKPQIDRSINASSNILKGLDFIGQDLVLPNSR